MIIDLSITFTKDDIISSVCVGGLPLILVER